jgi:hypothetical protein
VPLAFTYVDTNGYDHWAATLPVTLEIDPKTDVFITPNLYGGSLEADCLTVSGYLG